MKTIPLSQGKSAIVDDDVYEELSRVKWHAHKHRNAFYARRNYWAAGKCITLRMHESILGKVDGLEIDHVNGDGLDNRRSNLRFVTSRQNNQNLHVDKSSRFSGVCWDKNRGKWLASIKIKGSSRFLGRYIAEEDAAAAYRAAVESIGGVLIDG